MTQVGLYTNGFCITYGWMSGVSSKCSINATSVTWLVQLVGSHKQKKTIVKKVCIIKIFVAGDLCGTSGR